MRWLLGMAVCCIVSCCAATPADEMMVAVNRLVRVPTTGTVTGVVRVVFHDSGGLAPEAMIAAAKAAEAGAKVEIESIRNHLAETTEVFSGDDYFCTTTLYKNVSENDPATSSFERQVVVKRGGLIGGEILFSDGSPRYFVVTAEERDRLALHYDTAAKSLGLHFTLPRLFQSGVKELKEGKWSETQAGTGKSVRCECAVVNGVPRLAIESDLDLQGRPIAYRKCGLLPGGKSVVLEEVKLQYAGNNDYPGFFEYRGFMLGSDGKEFPSLTVTGTAISRTATPEASVPSVREFLSKAGARSVQDLRVGRDVPFSEVKFGPKR
jgi:hypothetical protein